MKLDMRNRKTIQNRRKLMQTVAAEAALRLELLDRSQEAQSKGFRDWLWEVSPTWEWDLIHLQYVRYFLDKLTRGLIKNLMVFMPPRHGKSEHASIRYPAYRMELDPTLRVLLVTHSQDLATSFSRDIRRIVAGRMELSRERKAAHEWFTKAGGGLKAVGVAGVGGGLGFKLIVMDDLVKNALVAQSEAFREHLRETYLKDIKIRRHPDASMILQYTRWHHQDIGGQILESDEADEWVVVRLPALAEENDPLGRPEGMALWPKQWSRRHLLSLQKVDPNGFEALYQQSPTLATGDMFLKDWFMEPDAFVEAIPPGSTYVRYWDKAATKGGTGAATAGALMVKTPAGMYIIAHMKWGRWKPHDRERHIKDTAFVDGPNVTIWQEQEPGSGGKESAENTTFNLAGFDIRSEPIRGNKVFRAFPLAAQFGIGNVKILRDSPTDRWNRKLIDEFLKFPQGVMKDQVDACSGAFNKLALVPAMYGAEVSGSRLGIPHTIQQMQRVDPRIWRGIF